MRAISFLGTGNYLETEYVFSGKAVKTPYFPAAFKEFVSPDQLIVLMTDEAEKKHGEELQKVLDFTKVKIPLGKTETEIWEIFKIIVDSIGENEETALDITHGFRTQPLIAIASLLYLKAAKNISVKSILYGAFEARDADGSNKTPVFDLKPFLDIMEWSFAVQDFVKNGDMKGFGTLLTGIQRMTYVANNPHRAQQLQGSGNDLMRLTDSLATLRISGTAKTAANFLKNAARLPVDFKNHPETAPFESLIDKVKGKIQPLAVADGNIFSEEGFEAQREMMKWYLETNQVQQCLTLAREYVVSRYIADFLDPKQNDDYLNYEKFRSIAEKKLSGLSKAIQDNLVEMPAPGSNYAKIFGRISQPRNNLDHAGMKPDKLSADSLITQTRDIMQEVLAL